MILETAMDKFKERLFTKLQALNIQYEQIVDVSTAIKLKQFAANAVKSWLEIIYGNGTMEPLAIGVKGTVKIIIHPELQIFLAANLLYNNDTGILAFAPIGFAYRNGIGLYTISPSWDDITAFAMKDRIIEMQEVMNN